MKNTISIIANTISIGIIVTSTVYTQMKIDEWHNKQMTELYAFKRDVTNYEKKYEKV